MRSAKIRKPLVGFMRNFSNLTAKFKHKLDYYVANSYAPQNAIQIASYNTIGHVNQINRIKLNKATEEICGKST